MYTIQTGRLPILRNYAACERWARDHAVKITKRTRPVWGPDCIPLHKTRAEHFRLERKPDRWGLMLYATEVVGHYVDGSTLLNASYCIQSTRDFLRCMSNYDIKKTVGGYAYVINGKYHKVRKEPLLISAEGIVTNAEDWEVTKIVSNREQRKLIKERLKPFLTWYDAMTSIANNLRGVVGDAQTERTHTNLPLRFVCITNAWEVMLRKAIEDGHAGSEDEWRAACWSLLGRLHNYWYHDRQLDSSNEVMKVRETFIEKAHDHYDGWKTVTVIAPAGEKP